MPREVKWAISFLAGAGLLWVGWRVYAVLIILHIIVCFTLMIVVLLQSGEAADLAGAFGGAGSQTAFGPRGAATFLSKATTWCAVMFMLTSTALTIHISSGAGRTAGSSLLEQFSKPVQKSTAPAPTSTPLPFPAPATPAAPGAQTAPPVAPAPAQSPNQTPPKQH
ncbi:MAG TPA: preprotein translocase subunit SecG [Methylomirabilota bacterium]|jgi:preprotein translocase subunit SecG|nr:preprotein translocase subunit SecG [Methylomirabilota bacterium]